MKYHEKPAHFRELFSNLLPILLALFIWTNPVLAQNNGELITLSLKNKTIGEALETINKRYNYTFVLRTPDIDTKRKVSIDAKQQKIEDVLNNLFRGQDVSFDINNKTVRISKNVRQKDAESTQGATARNVTGQVTDSSGEPMIGVSVMVKGSNNGVVTNMDGKYEIKIDHPNQVLQYSFLGYLSQEKRIGDNRMLNVTLEEDVKKLDEVVVVGYSVQKKKDITGAVSTVLAKDIENIPVNDFGSALAGRSAGVQVITPSGKPNEGFSIRVRGATSINAGNEPLYVVDGVPYFDGGIADPVPVQKALEDGYDRVILILSRLRDEVRKQQKDLAPARIHPAAAEKLRMRYKTYNDELELAKHYEAEGRVLILAPEDLYGLNTLKKNFEGLEMMYRKGYAAAEAIPAFLQA